MRLCKRYRRGGWRISCDWRRNRKWTPHSVPPVGGPDELLDDVQLKIFQYCNKIEPRYIPKIEIVEYQEVNLVYLKCAAGDAGPYQASVDVYSKKKAGKEQERTMKYWIRPASFTVEGIQRKHGEKRDTQIKGEQL